MLKTQHIVVTEEARPFRRLTKIALESADIHNITEVDSYQETLCVLQNCKVDLLIFDASIDDVSAFPYIRRIRCGETRQNRNVPIILLYDREKDDVSESYLIDQATEAGATACVSKPLSIKKLIPVVRASLRDESADGWSEMHIVAPSRVAQLVRTRLPRVSRLFGTRNGIEGANA